MAENITIINVSLFTDVRRLPSACIVWATMEEY